MEENVITRFQKGTALTAWALLVAFVFYINQCTPPLADDWYYNWNDWGRIIPDAWREYFDWNPRITGTLLTRVFALLPVGIVDIINTTVLISFFVLIVRIACGKCFRTVMWDWSTPFLISGLTFFLLQNPGQIMFWHCGVASYLFPVVFGLILMAALTDALRSTSTWQPSAMKLTILCIVTIASGMGTFNFSCGVFLVACAVFYQKYIHIESGKIRLHSGSGKLVLILILMIFCMLLLVVAPGNAGRLHSFGKEKILPLFEGGLSQNFNQLLAAVFALHFRFVVVYGLMLACFLIRRITGSWSRDDAMVTYGCLILYAISQAALLVSPVPIATRVYAPGTTFLIIAAFKIIYPLILHRTTHLRTSIKLISSGLFILNIPSMSAAYEQKAWWDRAQPMLYSSEKNIILPYYPADCSYMGSYDYFIGDTPHPLRNAILRITEKETIFEDRTRCHYKTDGGVTYALRDISPLKKGGQLYCENPVLINKNDKKQIWYPSPNKWKWWKPSAVWNRLICTNTQTTSDSLSSMGYESAWMENGRINWAAYPTSLKKPKLPTLWIQIPGETAIFERCQPKPTWR